MNLANLIGAHEVYGRFEIAEGMSYALIPPDGFLSHAPRRMVNGRWLARLADTRVPDSCGISPALIRPEFTELTTNFNAYHILNWMIYLASNDLLSSKRPFSDASLDWDNVFDLLAYRVPRKVVVALFSSNNLSIRAVWENAMREAEVLNHGKALDVLVELSDLLLELIKGDQLVLCT